MIGYALRKISNLRFNFCSLNKQTQGKPGMKAASTNYSYTFDVINHYDQISKIKGKGAIVSLMPCYPQYQVTKQGSVVVKMKYTRNYIYLWRFQPMAEIGKEVNNKESLNFPISYENCGYILDLCDQLSTSPEIKLEEQTIKGNLTFTVQIDYPNKAARISLQAIAQQQQQQSQQQQQQQQDQKYEVQIALAQFKLICEQMKQGLPLVTGWLIPEKFLFQINKEQSE
ncbi:unnamed protein product [Paramecium pentaurelia]|uniref:Uncharacterized protein n=1 Tax=Paramecium pentaurelia TaxID=43138 RepID=A0A8S1VH16_9CILI|nr:unnamed protein product [Paramecium pentaurelia]